MRSILIAIMILIVPNFLFGQFNETIRSGRPGQGIGAHTIGKKVFQIQSGISYNKVGKEMDEIKSFASNTVLRVGIFEKVELRGIINWQSDKFQISGIEEIQKGISNTEIGGRINILESNGAKPGIGIQGSILLKTQGDDFKREKLGSNFILATENNLTDWLSLGTNWGVTWSGNNSGPEYMYTLNFGFGITENFGGFCEIYGSFDDFKANYDAGFSLLVTKDLQLDFSGGWQGDADVSDWFLDFGVSWRWDWRNDVKLSDKEGKLIN